MAKGNNAVWEVRPGSGSDTNGGAYDATVSGAGTDYSQQNSAQLSVTDLVGVGTTTLTSVTGGFTSAMIGNALYQNGDSDRYYIMAVGSSNSITVDRATGTFVSKTCNVGGALASFAEAWSSRGGINQNVYYGKGGTDETVATELVMPYGNTTSGEPAAVIGYTTTRGDNGFYTLKYTGSGSHWILRTDNTTYVRLYNIRVNGQSAGSTRGINFGNGGYSLINNCEIRNTTSFGFVNTGASNVDVYRLFVKGVSGTAAIYSINGTFEQCVASGNATNGFYEAGVCAFNRCMSLGNTNGVYGFGSILTNGVVYGNSGDGVNLNSGNAIVAGWVRNCIIVSNGGYGIDNQTTGPQTWTMNDYNAFKSNTSGNYNGIPAGANDVTLSADPFVNSGATIDSVADAFAAFALNSTAGGGTACKGVGNP